MAPKKKGKKEGSGGGGGGDKKKNDAPTEVEREELRLKVHALEQKLLEASEKLEALELQNARASTALEKQQRDQADITGYLKKEIEKKVAENAALEKKYVALREAKDNEEMKLQHELTLERSSGQSMKQQHDASVEERIRLEERLTEFTMLKELAQTNKVQIAGLTEELESTSKSLAHANQQIKIVTAPEALSASEQGGSAVTLLLLEAIRAYPSKHMLIEQSCYALQAVLGGDRKEDCIAVRKHGGIVLVLDAMRKHEVHAGLQAATCGLLWKLAFADPPTRKVVVQEGGVQLVLHAMQLHIEHPRLQYNACGALRHLLVHGMREYSVSSQIVGARPGELPPINGVVPREAQSERKQERKPVARPGGVRALHTGGITRGSKTPISLRGSRSVPTLNRTSPPRGRLDALSPSPPSRDGLPGVAPAAKDPILEQALDLTFRSMSEHAEQSLVQEYGCGTLWNLLMANPTLKQYVYEVEGVKLVLDAMKGYPMQTGVQLNACAVVKEFATYQKTLDQMKAFDARELLRAAITNHPFNKDLIAIAEEALHLMPSAPAK